MIGGVTRYILPHPPEVPHLYVNRPYVFETVWTRVRTCQNGYATPLYFTMNSLKLRHTELTVVICSSDHQTVASQGAAAQLH